MEIRRFRSAGNLCALIFGLLCSAIFLLSPSPVCAQPTKVRDAIQKGATTAEAIDMLTPADIPEDWRARRTVVETESNVVVTFSRNGKKVMEVHWSKRWVGNKSGMFACALFADDKEVARVMSIKDSVTVLPTNDTNGIMVGTTVKKDGSIQVGLIRKDMTFIDTAIIKGRESHLMDDLEYTKGVLTVEMAVRPMVESMVEGLHEATEKRVQEVQKKSNK